MEKPTKIRKHLSKVQNTRYSVGIKHFYAEALNLTDQTECTQELNLTDRTIILRFAEVAK